MDKDTTFIPSLAKDKRYWGGISELWEMTKNSTVNKGWFADWMKFLPSPLVVLRDWVILFFLVQQGETPLQLEFPLEM